MSQVIQETRWERNHRIAEERLTKIVSGESNAIVLSQDDIAKLFALGITDKHSSTNNYRSVGNVIMHYGTIEGIRTNDGVLIANSQCWSLGFAHCSFTRWAHGVKTLPLSSLENHTRYRTREVIQTIKLLDENKAEYSGFTLFTMASNEKNLVDGVDYWLSGRDDGRGFLVRLPESVKTVKEAIESLKPEEAIGVTTKRQGDLIFIPTVMVTTDKYTIDKAHFVPLERHQDRWNDNSPIIKTKKLYTPEISIGGIKTRHMAQEMMTDMIYSTYVKGNITHPQHPKLTLKTWHLVKKNRALESIDTTLVRGNGGGVD